MTCNREHCTMFVVDIKDHQSNTGSFNTFLRTVLNQFTIQTHSNVNFTNYCEVLLKTSV